MKKTLTPKKLCTGKWRININVFTVFFAVFYWTRHIKISYGFEWMQWKCLSSDSVKTTKARNYEYVYWIVIEFWLRILCKINHQMTNEKLMWMYATVCFWIFLTTPNYVFKTIRTALLDQTNEKLIIACMRFDLIYFMIVNTM